MKHEVFKYGIENTGNLNTLQVDRAAQVGLSITDNGMPLEDFKGVWNVTQGKFANVVSKDYQIIQHKDITESLGNAFSRLGIEVKGMARAYNQSLILDLIFKDKNAISIKDDATGIELGMRAVNSYDKTTSFRLEMFGYRRICMNGMVLGNVMNEIRTITMHVGDLKTTEVIERTIEKFIADMINSSEKLQTYVNLCMEDSIEWDIAKKLLTSMIKIEKHRKKILELLGGENRNKALTRWDFYNALTNYATHGEQLSPNVEGHLQNMAQEVMLTRYNKLIEVYPNAN